MTGKTLFTETLQRIRAVDPSWVQRAEARQLELTKPPGSLGRLEEIANRCAAIFESLSFTVTRPRLVVFAGDHGVCAEGVNVFPQAVTAQMVLNFLSQGAAINCLAGAGGIELKVVDVGVASPLPDIDGLIRRRVAPGTGNFCAGPAMTDEETLAAIGAGIEMASQAAADGCTLLGFGEMGIGNTTAASALTAVLTGLDAAAVTGRGTGAGEDIMARKVSAVKRALALHAERLSSPLEALACVGGLEIAAMCGFCLGAAASRVPVLTDGFIATSGAALAVKLHPAVNDYLFAAHSSTEPGHRHLLALLGQHPLLDLQMRLGEGTGAVLAMKVVEAAVAAFTGMATFTSAGVAGVEIAAGSR